MQPKPCKECGQPGTRFKPFGIDCGTLCDKCFKENNQRMMKVIPQLLVEIDSEITQVERNIEANQTN